MQTPNWRKRFTEEFKRDGIYSVGISTWPNGDIDFTASADGISDWWIKKMEKVEKESIEQAIEVVGIYKNEGDNPTETDLVLESIEKALKTLLH